MITQVGQSVPLQLAGQFRLAWWSSIFPTIAPFAAACARQTAHSCRGWPLPPASWRSALKTATPPAACASKSSISSSARALRAPTRPVWTPTTLTSSASIFWLKTKSTSASSAPTACSPAPTAARKLGYYSEQEFSFAPYEPLRPGILELGRAAIDREHRTPEVLTLLWRGIAQYATDMGLRYLIGCSSLTSKDPAEGWQIYRQLEHYRVPPEFETEPTAAYACPTEQLGAQLTAVALHSGFIRAAFISHPGQGPQVVKDLPRHWRPHRRPAGMGPGVRHHRFPYSARSPSGFAFGAQSLPGPAHDMSLRAVRRAVALAFALLLVVLRYWVTRLRGPLTMRQKARWSQAASRIVLSALGIHYHVEGQPPTSGLVVCNHLSYLDILILAANMPSFFVAKMEISSWPFFGMAAQSTAPSSLTAPAWPAPSRCRPDDRPAPASYPGRCSSLKAPAPTAARFCASTPRLIDPATSAGIQVTAAAVRYRDRGRRRRARSSAGMATRRLFPTCSRHLARPASVPELCFGQPRIYPDRRTAANATWAEVTALREHSLSPEEEPVLETA